MGNGAKAAQKRERNGKEGKKEPASQLKSVSVILLRSLNLLQYGLVWLVPDLLRVVDSTTALLQAFQYGSSVYSNSTVLSGCTGNSVTLLLLPEMGCRGHYVLTGMSPEQEKNGRRAMLCSSLPFRSALQECPPRADAGPCPGWHTIPNQGILQP